MMPPGMYLVQKANQEASHEMTGDQAQGRTFTNVCGSALLYPKWQTRPHERHGRWIGHERRGKRSKPHAS
jgi:hypothetical protein